MNNRKAMLFCYYRTVMKLVRRRAEGAKSELCQNSQISCLDKVVELILKAQSRGKERVVGIEAKFPSVRIVLFLLAKAGYAKA